MAEEMFKTTLMGGFDKDDVQEKVQKMKQLSSSLPSKKRLKKKNKELLNCRKDWN